MNSVWKTDEGIRGRGGGEGLEVESIVLLFFDGALIVGGWRVVGWGRKSYLGPAKMAPFFFSRDFSRSNKHDTFWHVVLTGYFYVLFLLAIAVSDFRLLVIYKNLGLPFSTITFTVDSRADNHFYKYIYLFQISYSMKSVFLLKHTLRF